MGRCVPKLIPYIGPEWMINLKKELSEEEFKEALDSRRSGPIGPYAYKPAIKNCPFCQTMTRDERGRCTECGASDNG